MDQITNLLTQGLTTTADPTRLHAELWADYVSKVTATWLPLFMATIVVGRDLFGSGTKCFPVDLTDTPYGNNETIVENISYTPSPFNGGISDYTRQLAEYVDVYCSKQDHYNTTTMFNYLLFIMMLVVQAGILYTPTLLWNITTARKIMCNLRFLMHDAELLYQYHRGKHALTKGSYDQKELQKNVSIWIKSNTLYERYMLKQLLTAVLSMIFISLYSAIPSLTASNLYDEFLCSVKEKFTVDCAVPSAMVHRCVWWTNQALLCLNVCSVIMHIVSLKYNTSYGNRQPFRDLGIELEEHEKYSMNDGHLTYTFLRANMEFIEKYNYVRVLEDVVSEDQPPNNIPELDPAPYPFLPPPELEDVVSDPTTTSISAPEDNPLLGYHIETMV